MDTEININNRIFGYAIIGALLFIAAIVFLFANHASIAMFELSYTTTALALGFTSLSLLYKAIKYDKHRLKQI